MVLLRAAVLLLALSPTNAFLIRQQTISASRISASPIKILKSHVQRPSGQVSLHASATGIVPYYEELMERMPSKKVLEVVDKANGTPIVASGE